jgi:1-acyl-sn-glycerol-3-phosphate acyltransferase
VRPLKLILLVLLFSGFLITAFVISLSISLLRLPRWRIVSELMRCFNRILRTLVNVKIDLEGARDGLSAGGHFIASNHLGYLDGIVLGSLFPVIFVTKREVKRWPVIGQLLTLLGTIFVDRENKQDILRVIDRISGTLRQGANVLIFPEGTSTNGERLLPFQSAFFAAPLMAGASVAPLTIRYRFVDRESLSAANRDRLYWYGDMSFAPHLWNLLGANRIEVSVKIHPRIETSPLRNSSCGRKQLSQACHEAIAQGVNTKTETGEVLHLFPIVMRRQPFLRYWQRDFLTLPFN